MIFFVPFTAYKPSDESNETMKNVSHPIIEEFHGSTAYIIYYEQLQALLKLMRCSECSAPMIAKPREVGSALVIEYRCQGCDVKSRWESQPRVGTKGGKFVGNVLSVTCTFLTWVISFAYFSLCRSIWFLKIRLIDVALLSIWRQLKFKKILNNTLNEYILYYYSDKHFNDHHQQCPR